MSAVLLGHFKPDSPQWHDVRATGLGASDIAAVVGLSPWVSPFALWHQKKGTLPGPSDDRGLFYWGHALEPLVAERFASTRDGGTGRPDWVILEAGTYASSAEPWQLANPDRLIFDGAIAGFPRTIPDAVLEIKTSRYGDGFGPHMSDEIPLHVRAQVTQQMDVMGVDHAWVAVLIGGSDYREYRIGYDADDAKALRDAGAAFWASLQNDTEPPIDASYATYETVRALHPDINGEDVDLDAALHHRYALSKIDADSATDAHRQAKSELLTALGTARRGLVDGVPVVRRQPGRGGAVSLYEIKEKSA